MANFAQQRDLNVSEVRDSASQLKELAKAHRELAIDVGLAVGGAVPGYGWIADGVSLARSVAAGDPVGIVFDVVGFIPIVGDAAKGARVVDRFNDVRRGLDQLRAGLTRTFRKTEDISSEFWRSKRNMSAYNEALRSCSTQKCYNDAARLKGPQYGQAPVSGGQWSPRTARGDGLWIPEEGSRLDRWLDTQDPRPAGVEFENGFPKFDDFSQADVKIPMTGKHTPDLKLADDVYRKEIGDPEWQRPPNMTWHHKEDGTTMQLVPSDLNQGVSHMGGAALFKENRGVGDDF